MLKVKHLTPFKPEKKEKKKGGNFDQGCKKSSSARFCLAFHCRVLGWFQPNFSSLLNASGFRALALILFELWPFSPYNIWKSWPPPPGRVEM